MSNEPLTDKEQRFVALALQGLAMRAGPDFFQLTRDVVRKLQIEEYFSDSLANWISFNLRQKQASKGE